MPRTSRNMQLFALRQPPPEALAVAGGHYCLVRVFKHDFFAATCLYEAAGPAAFGQIVVKFGRTQPFCGLPMAWYGRLLQWHEGGIYAALADVAGVPRWVGCVGRTAYAIEYIDAVPLDHLDAPPPGFFDRLLDLVGEVHRRGVAYCDANKRSNILVDPEGRPFLIDYQIALRLGDRLPRPLRAVLAAAVRYMQRRDLYHFYKHKRRLAPDEMTPLEAELSRRRGPLHALHRKLTDPWRRFRRRFLRGQDAAGRLESPTADREDHDQPEKATWRERGGDQA